MLRQSSFLVANESHLHHSLVSLYAANAFCAKPITAWQRAKARISMLTPKLFTPETASRISTFPWHGADFANQGGAGHVSRWWNPNRASYLRWTACCILVAQDRNSQSRSHRGRHDLHTFVRLSQMLKPPASERWLKDYSWNYPRPRAESSLQRTESDTCYPSLGLYICSEALAHSASDGRVTISPHMHLKHIIHAWQVPVSLVSFSTP